MHASLVLTVIGPDRPGLVEALASTVADHDGNWIESRMARLAGQFAGILLVNVPGEKSETLIAALRVLESRHGLHVTVTPADTPAEPSVLKTGQGAAEAESRHTLHFEFLGHDRPGIVRHVSRALAQRHVNVVDLETNVFSAPMTGEPLFRAIVEADVPPAADRDELHAALEAAAAELGMDVTFA